MAFLQKMKYLTMTALLAGGLYMLWENNPQFRSLISQYVENGEFLTLEAKYTADQIMTTHKRALLADSKHTYQEPTLRYYPYLLLDIKYTQADKKTREGVVLWSLVDGEMVLNTDTWEQTHGFADAIKAGANRPEFMILNALAKHKGILSRDKLQQELNLDSETLDPWIDSIRYKHLVIQKGNELQLHFQNPKILVSPETKLTQSFVSKPYTYMQRVSRKFSQKQIEKVTKAAFGQDFTIREVKEVFLPVYRIDVLNPDGSLYTSHWNALTGEKIQPRYAHL